MDSFSILGLGLILLAFFCSGVFVRPPPGIFSLIPVLDSALLILASANSLINRTLLSWNWVVFIGLISYSLYLWHWPILAYVRIFFAEPINLQLVIALLCSFLVSFLVYRYIENPVRTFKAGRRNPYRNGNSSSIIVSCIDEYFEYKGKN